MLTECREREGTSVAKRVERRGTLSTEYEREGELPTERGFSMAVWRPCEATKERVGVELVFDGGIRQVGVVVMELEGAAYWQSISSYCLSSSVNVAAVLFSHQPNCCGSPTVNDE